jgi:hypothetical protein
MALQLTAYGPSGAVGAAEIVEMDFLMRRGN